MQLQQRQRKEDEKCMKFKSRMLLLIMLMSTPTSNSFVDASCHSPKRQTLAFASPGIHRQQLFEKRECQNGFARLSNRPSSSSSTLLQMAVGKTGAKVVKNVSQFRTLVLETEIDRPVMVFFTAGWCTPCALEVPVIKEVMSNFQHDIQLVEVSTDLAPNIAKDVGILSVPAVQLYHDGQILDTIVGCVSAPVLSSCVKQMLSNVAEQKERERMAEQRRQKYKERQQQHHDNNNNKTTNEKEDEEEKQTKEEKEEPR